MEVTVGGVLYLKDAVSISIEVRKMTVPFLKNRIGVE